MILGLFICIVQYTVVSSQVIVEDPGPVPINSSARYSCTVSEGLNVTWSVQPPDRSALTEIRVSSAFREFLSQRGINVEFNTFTRHSLIVGGSTENNKTLVQCGGFDDSEAITQSSDIFQVIFYGPPPAPANLLATAIGPGTLNISWSLMFMEGVDVNFTLRATNLSTSSTNNPFVQRGIVNQYYIYDVGCDRYRFEVMAVNLAGSSTFSEPYDSLPLPPDISPAIDSLQTSLMLNSSAGVQLTVTFKNITLCPDYPVETYSIVLMDSESQPIEQLIQAEEDVVAIFDGLRENVLYSLSINGTNQFGSSGEFAPIQIVTTDVQDVNISQVDCNTFSIMCTYLSGSVARGCVYTLVSEVKGDVNGTIDMGASEDISMELGMYEEVIVYDWESDDTTGNVPLRRNISFANCPTTAFTSTVVTTLSPSAGGPDIAPIIIPIVVIIVVLIVLILILVCFVLYKKGRCKQYGLKHKVTPGRTGGFKNKEAMGRDSEMPLKLDQGEPAENDTELQQFSVETDGGREEEKEAGAGDGEEIDHLYSCLSKPAQEVKTAGPPAGADVLIVPPPASNAEYAELNQGHIYQVLENPNLVPKKRDSSLEPDDAPPIPAYCPAGGDSPERELPPQPHIPAPSPLLQAPSVHIPAPSEYAEIGGVVQ